MGVIASRQAARKAKNTVTRDQFNAARKGLKKTVQAAKKKVGRDMRNLASYTWKSVRNSIKPGAKKRKQGAPLYIYGHDGKRLCTVEQYLAGAYRAYGQNKTAVRAWYAPNATITSGRLSKKRQKRGTYILKGTGKFSSYEQKNIDDVRNRDKTERQLRREIEREQKEIERLTRDYSDGSWSDEQKSEAKAEAKAAADRVKKLEKRRQKNQALTRHHEVRIVARNKHDVPARDVQEFEQLRNASKPGNPPKTWTGSIRNAIWFDANLEGFRIVASPRKGGTTDIFPTLEYGGTVSNERYGHGDLMGYQIVDERSEAQGPKRKQAFSHKRVSLARKYDTPENIKIAPRPFFEPTIKHLEEVTAGRFSASLKDIKLQPFF